MLETLVLRGFEFDFEYVVILLVLDEELEGGDDFEYAAEGGFFHAIII